MNQTWMEVIMYIRFIVDPRISRGIHKIVRRVVKDLRGILKDVTYSVEEDDTLPLLSTRESIPISKIFQRKLPMVCPGIAVYIVNFNLIWCKNAVHGISSPSRCAVGLGSIQKNNSKTWSAKIWDVILHELGHSLGLIKNQRARSSLGMLGSRHCLNDCVMSEDKFDFVWSKKAQRRFDKRVPFCQDCLKYLLAKDA